MKTYPSNSKRSRLIRKTDEELLLEILVRVERVGSFCPEDLMGNGYHQLFEEAYRRFETWDEIIEQCIKLSNQFDLIGMTPKEVILAILRLEYDQRSFQEADVLDTRHDLHAAAVLFYGSWNRALTVAGLKAYDQQHESLEP
jgi:hypothetical protein